MTKNSLAPYKLMVREEHLDTFGHVNNAVYLELYESARWEYITSQGYGMKEVKLYEKGPVILELNLKFKKELGLREEIMIETDYPIILNSLLMKMNQRIIKCSTKEVASELTMTFGLFDLRLRKLIAPTAEWLKVMGVES
jgi:YbgC/YbaW family acyl-CoA thioester hydrolase